MKAIRVQKEKAEEIRKFAEKIGAKDRKRFVKASGDFVEIPILDGYEHFFEGYEIVEQSFTIENPRKKIPELLEDQIPKELHKYLPISYKIVGDLAILKLSSEIEEYKKEIGNAILISNPRLKAVWRDLGKEGMVRKPKLELLAGKGSETVHVENGCLFKLDLTKVMFSLGNQHERQRIARECEGEIVVDMFAGIGYFSIPIAKRAEKVYAIEINPEAYRYLLENIKLNQLNNVIPILGDSMFLTPEGVADRIVMGHIFCQDFLETAIKAIKKEGVIHYHESTPIKVLERPINRLQKASKQSGRNCKILNFRKVKNYSPGVVHVVVDALIY
ncbi:MAG: class I SAM-dependent methyltransferase family protein [Archaeoglobaceae archaeon]|nr:class I SAM-dependent methyltransferase family protein [Archaeoglobaceae archaeon]MDW8128473.1 class I SAM-dependent methyltransferase family protein [Archaeoglobaceae archaeon]